jgi:hypothetical protein
MLLLYSPIIGAGKAPLTARFLFLNTLNGLDGQSIVFATSSQPFAGIERGTP